MKEIGHDRIVSLLMRRQVKQQDAAWPR